MVLLSVLSNILASLEPFTKVFRIIKLESYLHIVYKLRIGNSNVFTQRLMN